MRPPTHHHRAHGIADTSESRSFLHRVGYGCEDEKTVDGEPGNTNTSVVITPVGKRKDLEVRRRPTARRVEASLDRGAAVRQATLSESVPSRLLTEDA